LHPISKQKNIYHEKNINLSFIMPPIFTSVVGAAYAQSSLIHPTTASKGLSHKANYLK